MLIKHNSSVSANVLVTGTFCVCHAGHCQLLEFAAQYGEVTVGINGDRYMKEKYGENAIPLINRAYVLSCNRFVHNVVFFDESDPRELIYQYKPKYYVRGPDYAGTKLIEQEALDAVGCKLIIHPGDKIASSSAIVPILKRRVFEPLPL